MTTCCPKRLQDVQDQLVSLLPVITLLLLDS